LLSDVGARDGRGLQVADRGHNITLDDPLILPPRALALLRVVLKEALAQLFDRVGALRLPDRLRRVDTFLGGPERVLCLVSGFREPEPLGLEGAEREAAFRLSSLHPVTDEPGPSPLRRDAQREAWQPAIEILDALRRGPGNRGCCAL
jgi:hypothetical protein